ncbi:MAG: response regulator, partial [Oscillospiraceae bacterium]|nr:response regulator [Oscillospiraceae bacterium]
RAGAPISDLMQVRLANMPVASDREAYLKVFDLERLQEKYYLGEGPTSLVIFSRRQSGRQCFIKYSAAMRKDPVTGDVIVLGVETEYNNEKVTEVLNDKVLAKQYDMVCYIVSNNYGVVIGDAANIKKGSIFPKKRDGIYMDYIREQVLPVASSAEYDRDELLHALSPERIEAALAENETYTVDVACEIGGEIYNKRFTYYSVDRETHFYILLKSDITDVLREQREREQTQTVYNSMLDQFNAMADESLAVQRTNLTTGLIEEVRGRDLYDTDFAGGSIAASALVRSESFLVEGDREKYEETFALDKLLERTSSGQGPATFVGYCRRQSGRQCFVKFSGSASRNPVTGDVIALGVETEYNTEMVNQVLDEKVLAQQYDMITYIVSGYYGVAIGDAANIGKGSIFPRERNGVYADYIREQVAPVLAGTEEEKSAMLSALSLETIEALLAKSEPYTADIACKIDGEIYNKRFMFYAVDREKHFYILLKSDMTDVVREQRERERSQSIHNSMMDQFNAIADESLTVIRSNMTTGLIEDVRGRDLYPTDYAGNAIPAYANSRLSNLLVEADKKKYTEFFDMEKLLERTARGEGPATLVCYCRRANGRRCFVKFSGSASRNPVTGDVDAFGIETEYNTEMVSQVMNEKILAQQYDMVTYLVSGYYGVTIGDAANIVRGSIFPKQRDGVYMDYIREQVIPVVPEGEREATLKALSLETVEAVLAQSEPYTVDVTCEIDGEIFNKRFMFYAVDRENHFYILLKSDMTDVLREQRERNELLANALHDAEQANMAKTAFLSSMSHEIRTPMNAIIGLDSIALKDPDLPQRTREQLEKIGGSAKHLLGLINDILDMSRIESGRMTIKNEEFSFREILEQINTMIHGQCLDRGLTYDCRIVGHVDDYYIGDDMKLKQVIINILGNSVKFTPAPGTVSFIVERTAQFEGKTTIRFTMSDTGVGMDKEFLPRIFEAFSQENENKANKYGSTGLGMAITKNIVEMMNGSITVESEKSIGSTFTVTVTLRDSDRVSQQSSELHPQDMKVLIIDDDPVACEHAKLVLEEVGITSDTCLSGAEALQMIELRHARRDAYNLILVDWKMPEQDGVAVTREIRRLYNDETTIIILTAYSWDDVMEEALNAGVDSFMAKPLFASNVMQEFKSAIARRGVEEEAEVHKADLAGRKVLLAEDMLINAEIMMELLGMREIQVEHAENGQIAVDMFAASPENYYDAILMDVRMPVKNGLEATAAIRALCRPDAKTVPIIAMTANAFDEDVQLSLQVGMNAHLTKPVEPDHLFETLEGLIRD